MKVFDFDGLNQSLEAVKVEILKVFDFDGLKRLIEELPICGRMDYPMGEPPLCNCILLRWHSGPCLFEPFGEGKGIFPGHYCYTIANRLFAGLEVPKIERNKKSVSDDSRYLDVVGIGKRIRQARKSRGFSINQLSDRSKLKFTDILQYEEETKIPTSGDLIKLADALDVRISFFFVPREQ